jgi:sigma-B regulation protein RsbU (phosphoserine phosphatase)
MQQRVLAMAVANFGDEPSSEIVHYREARSVPCLGDFIEVVPSSVKGTTIAITDVCGRDTQAQGHARYLRRTFRSLAADHSPAKILEVMNDEFCGRVGNYGDDRFATVFVATLAGRSLTYASAGHDFALLINANGRHRHLAPTGMLIGIRGAECYAERMLDVASGDWLIVVTDGITDVRDERGAIFGTSGVVRSAISAIRLGVDDPATRILEAAQTHACEGLLDDASVFCACFS